ELGLETFSRYREGKSIYVAPDGTRHEYEGTVFPADEKTIAEMDRLIKIMDDLAAEMDPANPWSHPKAKELDSISFR
ncbi:UNVERIFIED_CONTAM: putrescine oxidase, partial [Bacteroidetes bacterium 56_B9]